MDGDGIFARRYCERVTHGDGISSRRRRERLVMESSNGDTASVQRIAMKPSRGDTECLVATSETACEYISERVFNDRVKVNRYCSSQLDSALRVVKITCQ
jgi:hypothetical protein